STIQPLELTDDAVIKRRKKKDFDSNRNFGDCPLDEITKSTKDIDTRLVQHESEAAIELFPPLLDTEREETFYRADVDDVEQQAQVSLLDVSGENSIIRRKKKKDANESQRN
uniref:Uncharacterized protein n=1 Tax=Clytia hemisphaerica TaxID=252671 RepID=A0A7M5TZU5_9CNID